MQKLLILILTVGPLFAQLSVSLVGSTNTQALFKVRGVASCTVSAIASPEKPTRTPYTPNDVNPAVFPGSDSCTRGGNSFTNGELWFVLGAPRIEASTAAGQAGLRSRALQADTPHSITFTSGIENVTIRFRTKTIPSGVSTNRFETRPSISGVRDQFIIDHKTGMRIELAELPADSIFTKSGTVMRTPLFATGWSGLTNLAASDDLHATSTTNDKLFIPISHSGVSVGNHMSKNALNGTITSLQLTLEQHIPSCTGGGCVVNICLTVDGVNCGPGAAILQRTLTNTAALYTIGDSVATPRHLESWLTSTAPIDSHPYTGYYILSRSVAMTITGNTAVKSNGSAPYLDDTWAVGTQVEISGSAYTITGMISKESFTLSGTPPTGAQTVNIRPFGVLIYRDAPDGNPLTIDHVDLTSGTNGMGFSGGLSFDDGGDGMIFTSVGVRNGCYGLVNAGGKLYSRDYCTGVNTIVGATYLPSDGINYGSGANIVNMQFSRTAYDELYGVVTALSDASDKVVIKLKAPTGVWPVAPVTGVDENTPLRICGMVAAPCWTITAVGAPIRSQLSTLNPTCANTAQFTNWFPFGILAHEAGGPGHLMIRYASISGQQDYRACEVVVDLATGNVIAAADSWPFFIHSEGQMGGTLPLVRTDLQTLYGESSPGSPDTGPQTGRGPGIMTLAAPLSGTTGACPARPSDSPIPVGEWPTTGCRTVTRTCVLFDPTPSAAEIATYGTLGGACPAFPGGVSIRDVRPGEIVAFASASDPHSYVSCTLNGTTYCDTARILTITGNTLVIYGGRDTRTNNPHDPAIAIAHAAGDYMILKPLCTMSQSDIPQSTTMQFWDYTASPWAFPVAMSSCAFGVNGHSHMWISGAPAVAPFDSTTALATYHGSVSLNRSPNVPGTQGYWYIGTALSTTDAFGLMQSPGFYLAETTKFENQWADGDDTGQAESHPGGGTGTISKPNGLSYNMRTYQVGSNRQVGSMTFVTGTLWKTSTTSTVPMRMKFFDLFCMRMYNKPCNNISGPGSIISTSSDGDVCQVYVAGECRAGSVVGDTYLTIKSGQPDCAVTGVTANRLDMSYTCLSTTSIAHQAREYNILMHRGQDDWNGQFTRNLTSGLGTLTNYSNARTLVAADHRLVSWMANDTGRNGPARVFYGILPSPDRSSINRTTFRRVSVQVGGAGANAYIEWQTWDGGYCNPNYASTCRTTSSPSSTHQYKFASEATGADDTSCASGCTILVPFREGIWRYRVVRGGVPGAWNYIVVH